MKSRALVCCLVAVLTFNCASIVHQTTQQVRLNSDPTGANVTVSCGDVFNDPKLTTPAVVTLHRKPAICAIKLTKDGYADTSLTFGKQMSALYLGNILIGGIIGLVVDAANGAMWNRTDPAGAQNLNGELKVTLAPATGAPVRTGGSR